MHHDRENDPDRDRNARARGAERGRSTENIRYRGERDLGRAQAEGNLGNERTRNRSDERGRNDRDDMDENTNM